MLTGGISQALDFVCGRFARPGDVVFVEEPSYPYSFQIFRDHGLEVVGIPMDGAGMDVDALERELAERSPKLVYTIPAFHNPTGQVMDRARRERLVALSASTASSSSPTRSTSTSTTATRRRRHSAPCAAGNVLSLGTFSKILAPGLRLGWIQATPDLLKTLLASGALVSGGNFNHFTSHLVRKLMESGELAAYVAHLRASYTERAQAMDTALRKHLAGIARWQKPGGGYFFWLELPEGADTARSRPRPAPPGRASCRAAPARPPAASAIACACPSPITRCPTSTRASRACRRALIR